MNAPTVGPWVAKNDFVKDRLRVFGGETGCWTVAFLPCQHPTDAANAKLITAAPDLLSVVERFLEDWDNTYDGEPVPMDKAKLLDDAHQAVRKARGQ